MSAMFGRKKIVKQIWKVLIKGSVLFVAERRVGKTTVLNHLRDNPNSDYIVIYSDVEGVVTPLEFVEKILRSLSAHLNLKDNVKIQGWEVFKDILGSIKFPGVKKNWKPLLEKALTTICSNTDKKVLFLWDEIPYMLQKIHHHESKSGSVENNALEILDILRALRHSNSNLRMVFTGSVGLHHVLAEISRGVSAEPTNDMQTIPLEPLVPLEAQEMVNYLLEKEGVTITDTMSVELIINQCDRVPFYIEKIVTRLALTEKPVNAALVNQIIDEVIVDVNNELEMEHFRSRLSDYYTDSVVLENGQSLAHSEIVKGILDFFATTKTPLSIDESHRLIKTIVPVNRDLLITLLEYLAKDYYLSRNRDGYQFCFTLIKRWWIKARGLEGQNNG